jgi:hypothetical protein
VVLVVAVAAVVVVVVVVDLMAAAAHVELVPPAEVQVLGVLMVKRLLLMTNLVWEAVWAAIRAADGILEHLVILMQEVKMQEEEEELGLLLY